MDEIQLSLIEEASTEGKKTVVDSEVLRELVRLARFGLWVTRNYFRIASALNMIAASPKYGENTRKKAMQAFESMPSEGLPPNPAA